MLVFALEHGHDGTQVICHHLICRAHIKYDIVLAMLCSTTGERVTQRGALLGRFYVHAHIQDSTYLGPSQVCLKSDIVPLIVIVPYLRSDRLAAAPTLCPEMRCDDNDNNNNGGGSASDYPNNEHQDSRSCVSGIVEQAQ